MVVVAAGVVFKIRFVVHELSCVNFAKCMAWLQLILDPLEAVVMDHPPGH